ncbi:MAG: hypothetical protein DWI15_00270 [Planctomycetota bacterium]|nr:MAG: hypothetical protein DWI15_00270 [Planctomycetota bacterium]
MLRNSIAQCNVEFVVNEDRKIIGIQVWNKTNAGIKTWQAELTINDLRTIAIKFVELIEQSQRQD